MRLSHFPVPELLFCTVTIVTIPIIVESFKKKWKEFEKISHSITQAPNLNKLPLMGLHPNIDRSFTKNLPFHLVSWNL